MQADTLLRILPATQPNVEDRQLVRAALVHPEGVETFLETSLDEIQALNEGLERDGYPADWLYVTPRDVIGAIAPSRKTPGYVYWFKVRGRRLVVNVDRETFYRVVDYFGLERDDFGYDYRFMKRIHPMAPDSEKRWTPPYRTEGGR